jgi:tRNA (cmo5U34)-methyltransferase
MYISFENVIPDSEEMKQFELERWKRYQIRAGKTEEEAENHIKRCGVQYFPITTRQHIHLLRETGFQNACVFWRSYMQMGIMAFK